MREEAEVSTAVVNPMSAHEPAGNDVESVLSLESVSERLTVLEGRDTRKEEVAVANVFAQLSEAPTNWQYFLRRPKRHKYPCHALNLWQRVVLTLSRRNAVVCPVKQPCTSSHLRPRRTRRCARSRH